jgi:D-3-phosphoglycerate dehydrogenase / 2-oxoglutarate reductase
MTALIIVAEGTVHDTRLEEEHLDGRGIVRLATIDDPEQVREATRDAQAVVVTTNPLTAAHIAALGEGVRVIGRAGTGLDTIDLEAARARGLFVYHTPDYCTAEVATHAVAMILAAHRRLLDADRLARGAFSDWRSLGPIPPLDALTAGVVGSGRIGRAVIARLMPFMGRIVTYDPYDATALDGVDRVMSLDALLRVSDIVTLHLPLVPETRGLIGARELELLPRGAILVNVSRGGLLDEAALCAALESGRFAGAALDVLECEPPPASSPVLRAPHLVLTPHIAWYSTASELRVRTQVIDGVFACLAGDVPSTGRIAVDPRVASTS